MWRFCCFAAPVVACAPLAAQPVDPGPPAPIVEHVAHQEILTPLPLRVRLPAQWNVEHVLVLVKLWGIRNWQAIELERSGQTWTGEVSCREVSTVTGDTRYFFLALDKDGGVVGGSGSSDWPYVATVVRDLPEGAQGLPGDPIPARCHDPADCPPDFPGCPAYALLRPPCSSDHECKRGFCASDGYCEPTFQDYSPGDDEELLARAVARVQSRFKTATNRNTSRTR